MSNKLDISTRVIFAGQHPDAVTGALMTPIFANSTFVQEGPAQHKGMAYGRSGNPTRQAFEACVANLEGGKRGLAFASGMAATDAVLHLLQTGDHILAMDDLYGGTRRLFEKIYRARHGLDFTYHDFSVSSDIDHLVKPNTKMIWIETPTNPLLKIVDLESLIAKAKKHNILVVVDNTLCSPIVQRPLEYGADIVVHSVTKYLNGHSDMIGGMIVIKDDADLIDRLWFIYNAAGAVMGPFDAFLAMRGVKTLDVRMQRQMENASQIASFLESHPKISKVYYPGLSSHPQHTIAQKQMNGFGAMISCVIDAPLDKVSKFLTQTKLFTLAESLGGVESLIEHPALMTHASIPVEIRNELGIVDGLVRLSIGIENIYDLIDDLTQALHSL